MTAAPKMSPENSGTPETGLDADSLSAIRSILTEQEEPAPRRGLRRPKEAAPELSPEAPKPRRKADALPELDRPEPAEYADMADQDVSGRKSSLFGFSFGRRASLAKPAKTPKSAKPHKTSKVTLPDGAGALDRLKSYRPKRAHIALAAVALLVLFRPWLVMGVLILTGLIITGIFLIVGYDGFWQGVMKAGRWYSKRRPSRAAAVHAKLDRFAVRWDAILDRFPEGTVDGLYLPDFGELASAEARHDAALERRLAGLSQKEA